MSKQTTRGSAKGAAAKAPEPRVQGAAPATGSQAPKSQESKPQEPRTAQPGTAGPPAPVRDKPRDPRLTGEPQAPLIPLLLNQADDLPRAVSYKLWTPAHLRKDKGSPWQWFHDIVLCSSVINIMLLSIGMTTLLIGVLRILSNR